MAENSRKRRRLDPIEICQQAYDVIRNFKKEDGALLCDALIRAPKRRQEPAYYDVVSNPIDLLRIQQKIRTDEYEDLDQMTVDIERLVKNAKKFYPEHSTEYQDACTLWDLYKKTADKINESERVDEVPEVKPAKERIVVKLGRPPKKPVNVSPIESEDAESEESRDNFSSSSSQHLIDEDNMYEELFAAVMNATSSDGRLLHSVFQLLPSRRLYPDYYQVIENPIDLKQIATKIQANEYSNLNEMEKDLNLLTKNACSYNEPGSQIYKDAKLLRKTVSSRKAEIEHSRHTGGKISERISKRARATQSLSAITAALQYDDSNDEMGEVSKSSDLSFKDEIDEDSELGGSHIRPDDADSSPFWQLYDAVHNYVDNQGNVLCEPFLKLPSRRRYADYYHEIKNPISLSRIRSKLAREDYGNLSDLSSDLSLMFENAKRYNRPDSKLFKDAVKLQRVMQSKVQELLADDESSDGEIEFTPKRPKGRPRLNATLPKATPKVRSDVDNVLRKRLRILYRCLMDYNPTVDDGRQPILVFMEKPSKKLYPDYYRVIAEPIDMVTIDSNIKNDRYTCEEELLDDLRLMFNNCRQYNEEGSVIYEDANMLERVLLDKARELGLALAASAKPKRRSRGPNLQQKLKALYEAIKEHRDLKGRQLASIFVKLPSKTEYPDYYEVIKKPIDLEKIGQKVKASHYENVEELLADIVLMFDNACRYNEPDSQIYKDALTLQRVALQTKIQLCEDEGLVPDVRAAVQELFTSLFAAVYNHQDEEGRCYTDSLAELPEHDEVDGKKIRAISLDLIKRRLDKGLYRRLDAFQEDIFLCFERARRLSRTDSQVFEDSIELQSHFIKQRDEFCRHGDVLSSPALNYSLKQLSATVEAVRQEKLPKEQPEEDLENKDLAAPAAAVSDGLEMSFNQETYRVGDLVYVEATERNMENHVYLIERLWTANDGQQMFLGNWFCRPNETFHLASRKFLEQELFKSDMRSAHPLSHIRGRCCVLNVKEYFKSKPEGFADKDIYVCESRYSTKARMFKKIKVWTSLQTPGVVLVPRDQPLEPKRVVSVFRDRIEKHKEELAELGEVEKMAEKELVNVAVPAPVPSDGSSAPPTQPGMNYYQQLNIPGHTLRTGDCVYVRAENGKQLIAQIDSMWIDSENVAFFHGPWYVTPAEISTQITGRVFYRQEVFLSSIEDTNPLMSVVGKCCVLDFNDYTTCRPTELTESDIFLCESFYEESRRQIKKLPRDGLKKYTHSPAVIRDEIYFFRRPIQPQRESSSLMTKLAGDELTEDSMDGAPPSVGSDSCPASMPHTPSSSSLNTPSVVKKPIKIFQKRMVTGYIIYSGEVRKNFAAKNPDATFGEVSRLVGNEWRNLPAHVKSEYEERSQRVNEETAAEMARNGTDSTPSASGTTSGDAVHQGDVIFECFWKKCDWQGEEIGELTEHLLSEPHGHVLTTINPNDTEFQCMWRGCSRIRKGVPPFPKMERLLRHVREIHIVKNQGRIVSPNDRNKSFNSAKKVARPSTTPGSTQTNVSAFSTTPGPANVISHPPTNSVHQPIGHQVQVQNTAQQSRQATGEPIFVAVPPKPQRLLHSEAYIKYIEGLHNQYRYISNWDKSLRATKTAVPDVNRLPSHWLASNTQAKPDANGRDTLSTLWALREHMLKDTLNISNLFN
ncbi:protein polybromo-1-like isoform X2 [Daphnia pulicaria]|uniref:protein polybromo-1-like isoform X2 n=1 Tax=Daphnia pulicaria TaxID=35523 RepID=UPI001EEAC102|nr:protein polybromo-1-like isoform X2 [Daphnia pulicaria]